MLTLIKGDLETIKKEMKEFSKMKLDEKKAFNQLHKQKPFPIHIREARNAEFDYLLKLYSVSKNLPVRVEGVIINYKVYSSFVKKLKRLRTSTAVLGDGVVIQYWKKGTLEHGKGILKLYDISPYFKDFQHIPVASEQDHD